MILEWILDFLQAAAEWALSPLPDESGDMWQHVNTIAENLGALNYFLPIAETVALVVAVIALFPVFLGITLALWVVAQLRGSSSAG